MTAQRDDGRPIASHDKDFDTIGIGEIGRVCSPLVPHGADRTRVSGLDLDVLRIERMARCGIGQIQRKRTALRGERALRHTALHDQVLGYFRKVLRRGTAAQKQRDDRRTVSLVHPSMLASQPYKTLNAAAPASKGYLSTRLYDKRMKWETNFSVEPCFTRICGDVDVTCLTQLAELENELIEPAHVVLDVEDLRYADTSFLRFLLRLRTHENKHERGSVRLVHVHRRLHRLLEITGLTRVFTCGDAHAAARIAHQPS